jgi:histidinol phosphatase-like enzyme
MTREDVGYLNTYDDLEMFPDVSMVKVLEEKGFELIGISKNQSGIVRGLIREDFVTRRFVHRRSIGKNCGTRI